MKYFINKDEMRLLALLHEHCQGYTVHYQFEPAFVKEQLAMDDATMEKAASFLKQFQLVDIQVAESAYGRRLGGIMSIWITGLGENMIRDIESQPGLPSKITKKVIEEGWDTLKQIIIATASGYLSANH